MGVPVFKIRHEIARHRIAVCSSNYTLYADMSNRIMKTLRLFTPHIEIYSIDEAFLRLDSLTERDLRRYASKMRDTVMRWTGVPVSIGIAPTKTLAKLAGLLAKRDPLGVYSAANIYRCVKNPILIAPIFGYNTPIVKMIPPEST
jgi:DNA polymerase V